MAADGKPASSGPDSVRVERILAAYNAGIERAISRIESLRVEQVLIDPQEDGTTKEARAVLAYSRSRGMEREITEPGLPHMVGRYTLPSLLGPELSTEEYVVAYEGIEEEEGVFCHRLSLEARVRDADHFDGTIWVARDRPGPVRIVGRVADPPWPATMIGLDKAFASGPHGIWLVRRHSGEAELSLLIRKKGVRHIFYEDYWLEVSADSTGTYPR
ncbi:MAG: hypothetical protein GF400_09480 [Candidatus Eisenbacteria bacterium]|nr:hypothetical protein [Candidatus Eisenbacteria bacterium]